MLGAVCYSGLSPESVSPSVARLSPTCMWCRCQPWGSCAWCCQGAASACPAGMDCVLLDRFPPEADKHRGIYLAWRSYFLLSLWGAVTVIA